jgi:NodT family efflux transporter outer membrane factor (OMF) lipoprotein
MTQRRNRAVFTVALLLTSALAGCTVGPDYQRAPPATPPTAEFKETSDSVFRPALPRDTIDRGPWWSIYGDPTLDGLMAQVEVSNQTLKENEAAYRQAVALIRQTQSQLYPTIGYTGGAVQRSVGGGTSTTGTSSSTVGNSIGQFSAGGSLSWEIDVWGSIRRTVESDAAAAQASAGTLAAARLSAQSSLATNYFSLRASDRKRQLYEQSVAAYARSLTIVSNQVAAGTASRLDQMQAQTTYDQARALLVAEGVNRAQFEHAIAALIGKAPAEVSIAPQPLPPDVPTIEAGIPSALLERRPDIASAERSMAAANAQIGVAVAAYYPSITLGGSISFANTMLNSLFTIASAVWSVGPQLSGTAIDGGARGAQVEGARANYDKTVATYRQTVLTAFQQVEDGLVQQRLVEQQEKVQVTAVAAAREAERLSLNQYEAGTIPYTTVVQTQTTALSAEQTLINIRLTRFSTSATLVTALGGGWRAQDLPVPALTPSSDPAPAALPAAAPPKPHSVWPF